MTAWQLSPVAGVGREIVHRIVGPFLGLLVGGPRVEGTEWLTDLPQAAADLPEPREPSRHPGPPPVARTARVDAVSPSPRPTTTGSNDGCIKLAGVVVRRRPVSAHGPGRRVHPRGRGIAGRRLARRDLPRGHPQPDRGRSATFKAGVGLDRRARRRARPAGPDRRPVGGPAARGTTATTASTRPDACASANRWSPPRANRHARSPSASKRRSAPFERRDPRRLDVAARRPGDPAGVGVRGSRGPADRARRPARPAGARDAGGARRPAGCGHRRGSRRFGRPRRHASTPARYRGEDHRHPARSRAAWDGGGADPHRASGRCPRIRAGRTRVAVEGVCRRAHRVVRGSGTFPAGRPGDRQSPDPTRPGRAGFAVVGVLARRLACRSRRRSPSMSPVGRCSTSPSGGFGAARQPTATGPNRRL